MIVLQHPRSWRAKDASYLRSWLLSREPLPLQNLPLLRISPYVVSVLNTLHCVVSVLVAMA